MTDMKGRHEAEEEAREAFVRFPEEETHRQSPDDFWALTPLCPPSTVDALEAARRLHRDIREWVGAGGFDPAAVEFRTGPAATQTRDGRAPLAQIAWPQGPQDWPAGLLQGRSYGGCDVFLHDGKRYYLEPSRFHLDMMPLD